MLRAIVFALHCGSRKPFLGNLVNRHALYEVMHQKYDEHATQRKGQHILNGAYASVESILHSNKKTSKFSTSVTYYSFTILQSRTLNTISVLHLNISDQRRWMVTPIHFAQLSSLFSVVSSKGHYVWYVGLMQTPFFPSKLILC